MKPKITSYLAAPLTITAGFIIATLVFMFVIKDPTPVPIFVIFAVIQLTCMMLFAILPGKGKTIARAISMFTIGSFIFLLAGLLGKNNFQLEGFFFYLFSGAMGGAIVHFIMAKIIGPIFFSRNWCSWGCWSAMIFDLLPYKKNIKWYSKKAGLFRYIHFLLSLGFVATLFFGFKYTIIHTNPEALNTGMGTQTEMLWFLIGNIFYYIIGISVAIKFKDNRAFCKYLCPLTVTMKLTNKITLLRIKGKKEECNNCGTCSETCPMAINIPTYIQNGTRVKSTECIMCMKCIPACPNAVLESSVGLDYANKEYLN